MQCIAEQNELVLLNGLKMGMSLFDDSLTYRKRHEWISQLDLMFCSDDLLKHATEFKVIQGNFSLPSDHAIVSCEFRAPSCINPYTLLQRAIWLNEYDVPNSASRRAIKYNQIDPVAFTDYMTTFDLPEVSSEALDSCLEFLSQSMYDGAKNSLLPPKEWDTSIARWRRLLESDSPKDIWYAINWKGELNRKENKSSPSPGEFKDHFERLLLAPDVVFPDDGEDTTPSPYIPLLDDPMTLEELETAVHKSNPNKACNRQGNSPGVTRLLPATILTFILQMFNVILQSSVVPIEWGLSKLIALFKKGKTTLCGNYRGIAINDILFRLFDMILGSRLSLWYQPCKEQAGGQTERDCIEQIMTLRLLIDYARKTRKKLFILFIDFEKAYDKVRRDKLFAELKNAGCGGIMLKILKAIYRNTKFLFETVIILTNLGVKQG